MSADLVNLILSNGRSVSVLRSDLVELWNRNEIDQSTMYRTSEGLWCSVMDLITVEKTKPTPRPLKSHSAPPPHGSSSASMQSADAPPPVEHGVGTKSQHPYIPPALVFICYLIAVIDVFGGIVIGLMQESVMVFVSGLLSGVLIAAVGQCIDLIGRIEWNTRRE